MLFNNLQTYRLPAGWAWPGWDVVTAEQLFEQLARKPFQPCGNQDLDSHGWVAPCAGGELVHVVGYHWLICLKTDAKILPVSVINQEADKRAEVFEQENGYKPGRKQMKELREQVLTELLPRAFTTQRRTFAWIDPAAGWLVVDAATQNKAEEVLEALRQTLDSLPLTLLRTEMSPASAMACWLAENEPPKDFTIDADCTLKSPDEDARAVAYTNGLDDEQIYDHIATGKLPTKLALTFDDRISFALTDKLEIKNLDFLDILTDRLDEVEADDAQQMFDASFALMTGELTRLLPALVDALGGEMQTQLHMEKAA